MLTVKLGEDKPKIDWQAEYDSRFEDDEEDDDYEISKEEIESINKEYIEKLKVAENNLRDLIMNTDSDVIII